LNPDNPQRYKLRHLYARSAKDPRKRSNAEKTRELDAEIAQHERDVREGEAQLAIEELLSLKLRDSLRRAFLSWRVKFELRYVETFLDELLQGIDDLWLLAYVGIAFEARIDHFST
jgi:hypothetical protein